MTKIYLFPKAARQMPEEELQPLIDELKQNHPDLTSEYVWYETRALEASLWEILTIYVAVKAADAAIDASVGKLVDAIVERGKKWVQRHRNSKGWDHRPFALTIRDAEGNLLAAIDIDRDGRASDAAATRPGKQPPPFDLLPDDIQ